MKALIVGAEGQLGQSLVAEVPPTVQLVALNKTKLDITDRAAVIKTVADAEPDIVINAAAYTAVDRAESEEAKAFSINAAGVDHLSEAVHRIGAKLIQISTDFVFDGKASVPYAPDAQTAPINAYGRSKLAGEHNAGNNALIIRTAWLYGPAGANFVRTMLRLLSERDQVAVVSDQIGTPTYAPHLAAAIWKLASIGEQGIHHFTDAGVASWYDFAVAVRDEAAAAALLPAACPIVPIATDAYPTPAKRPAYSVLDKQATYDKLGAVAPHWRVGLSKMMKAVQVHG